MGFRVVKSMGEYLLGNRFHRSLSTMFSLFIIEIELMDLLAKKSYGIQKPSFNGAIKINPCPISQHMSMQVMKQGFIRLGDSY